MNARIDPSGGPGELGLTVDMDQRENHLVVTAKGIIDFWNVGPLQEQLNTALKAGVPQLVLDLRDVTFVDSTGLGLLLSVDRRARAAGGWLRLADPHPELRRALHTTNLERRLDVYPSVEAATSS